MYFFIVNVTSRTGKAQQIWDQVKEALEREQISYEAYVTAYEEHARELADMICTKGIAYKAEHGPETKVCLVVVGGDGTVNEVINGMHHFEEIYFGYIATGSGNDLGRGLRISKDPMIALRGILQAKEVFPMDLGLVQPEEGKARYFAISSGIGIDADVCRLTLETNVKKNLNRIGLGRFSYVVLTIKALFTMPTTGLTAVFDKTNRKNIDKMIFVAGMNHVCEGGGVPMSPSADPQDGKLSVCLVHGIPRWKTFLLLPLLVMGKHEWIPGIDIIHAKEYELTLENGMVLHCDGEYLGTHKKLYYRCEPGKLQILK